MASKADEHIKKAEKYMKTSLLKWKPDLDSAIDEYSKAGVAYRNAKLIPNAIDTYCKIADLQMQNGSMFHSAKSLEQAALLCKESKEFSRMGELIGRAGQLFRENGNPDTASIVYEKAAKALETPLPEKAAEFYLKSADASEIEEKWRQAAEQAGQAARMWVRMGRLNDAAAALELKLAHCGQEGFSASDVAGKAVTAMVLVHLANDDWVAADKVYKRAIGTNHFGGTDDASPVTQLLQAYEEEDPDAGAEVLKGPIFKYMENDYAKLARDLKIPRGLAHSQGDAPSSGGGAATAAGAQNDEEDEEEGGLC